jgi:allantoin racemase
MPRLLLLNPNSTGSMTRAIAVAARAAAASGTRIVARNPVEGPAAIEGPYDQALCLQPLLAEVARGERDGCAATVIACFDDPGLDAARCLVRGPVLGIAQAAMAAASLVATRFGIVTTVLPAVAGIEELVLRYGAARSCAGVLAADVRVLALHRASSATYQRILDAAGQLLRVERAEAIVLGCAGMSALGPRLARDLGVPVIDGVAAAVKLAEGLLAMQLSTSKRGRYAAPLSGRIA